MTQNIAQRGRFWWVDDTETGISTPYWSEAAARQGTNVNVAAGPISVAPVENPAPQPEEAP